MQAFRLYGPDDPNRWVYEEATTPEPGEGEVLIRVHAAGIISTELSWVPTWTTRTGASRTLPVIPGTNSLAKLPRSATTSRTCMSGTWCMGSTIGIATALRRNTAWPASPMSLVSRPASITFTPAIAVHECLRRTTALSDRSLRMNVLLEDEDDSRLDKESLKSLRRGLPKRRHRLRGCGRLNRDHRPITDDQPLTIVLHQPAAEGCTSEKRAFRPSAIVGCARMASRKPV
jgi:hypothetical protein